MAEQESRLSVHRWHDGQRWVCVLAQWGRTKLHLLAIDDRGLIVHHVDIAQEERYLKPLSLRGQPYPLRRAALRFKDAGRRLGCSTRAKEILATALAQEAA